MNSYAAMLGWAMMCVGGLSLAASLMWVAVVVARWRWRVVLNHKDIADALYEWKIRNPEKWQAHRVRNEAE